MSHYIERWECGHVASQCRCPGPKDERTRPGKCPECRPMIGEMDCPLVGCPRLGPHEHVISGPHESREIT